jgi:hypothetical protein
MPNRPAPRKTPYQRRIDAEAKQAQTQEQPEETPKAAKKTARKKAD